MLITDLTQNLNTNQTQTLSLKQVRAEAKNWQVGSLLKAFVVSNSPKDGMTLNIQGQQYKVASQDNLSNLQVGQRLNLEVMKDGEQPQLKVVQPQVQTRETIQNEGLKRNLPIQKPLGQLLNTLENLIQQGDGKQVTQQVNQQIRALGQQILNMLPDAEKVTTADGLKQAIRDSGHFLENKLMQLATNPQANKQSLQQDIKTGLLRLLQAIKANTPDTPTPRPGAEAARNEAGKPPPVVYDKAALQANARQAAAASQNGLAPNRAPATNTQTVQNTQNAQNTPQPQAANTTAQAQARPGPTPQPNAPQQLQQPVSSSQSNITTPPQDSRSTVSPVQTQQPVTAPVGEARKEVEAGIARIQTNQINSMRTEAGQDKPALFVEIPIRNQNNQVNVMQLNIQRDRESGGPERPAVWSISLGFELVELGPIRAGMTLVGEKQISVNLWAEDENTVALFNEQMAKLRKGLQDAGLNTGHVGVQQGAPTAKEVLGNNDAESSGLLDIEV